MRIALRTSRSLARNPALSEREIFHRSLLGAFAGAMVGLAVVRKPYVQTSTPRTLAGVTAGVLVGMGATALAFGAKPNQLPRIMFGFPKG